MCQATRSNGEAVIYHYRAYRCPARRSKNDKGVHHLHACDLPALDANTVDSLVWKWVKEEIASPDVLKQKLKEVQQEQRTGTQAKTDILRTLYLHKETVEREMKRLAMLYAREEIPTRIVDDLIAEQGTKLKMVEDEIAKATREMETPLSDEVIQDLVAFSEDFRGRLKSVEESFEAKRTVIDGLDVEVRMVKGDDEAVVLRVSSILRPGGAFLTMFSNPGT